MSQKPETQPGNPAAKNSPSQAAQTQPAQASQPGGQSLEQVREILFGAQSRETEQRLAQIQQAMVEKHEALERQSWEVLKRLGDQLEALRAEQSKAMEQMRAEHSKAMEQMRTEQSRATEQTRAQATVEANKLRQSMDEAAKKENEARDALRSDMVRQLGDLNRKTDAISARVAEITEQLRMELVDRATLSAVFSEAALRLGAPAFASAGQDEGMDAILASRIEDQHAAGAGSKNTPGGKR